MTQNRKQLLHNTFVTALEGGIGYWSQCTAYHWRKKGLPDGASNDEDLDGFYATIEVENNDEKLVKHRIDASVMERGFTAVIKGIVRVRPDLAAHIIAAYFVSEFDPDGYDPLDATEADIVVQAGLFGEVIYG